MASLAHVTRPKILGALGAYDLHAGDEPTTWRGFRTTSRYEILHDGRRYPSKAIIGAAADLRPADFFGGIAQTLPVLERCGFKVLRDGRPVVSLKVEQLARRETRDDARGDLDDVASIDHGLGDDVTSVFASGSNRPQEIRGFAAVGHDIGVAAPELSVEAVEELKDLRGTDLQVFCDSGAFSEVSFKGGERRVVKPMGPESWHVVLSKYVELAGALGDQLWIVAPDCVGDQTESLRRLREYAAEVRELHSMRARILLPVQKGELSQGDYFKAAQEILQGVPLIPAMPCKKAATTPEELEAFMRTRGHGTHVHLLGLGPKNPKAAEYLEAARWGLGSVSLDSAWLPANVGRTNGRGGGPRRFTRARDRALELIGKASGMATTLALLLSFGFGA